MVDMTPNTVLDPFSSVECSVEEARPKKVWVKRRGWQVSENGDVVSSSSSSSSSRSGL